MHPHWFATPGSGSVLGMRIRIQEQESREKLISKCDWQPFKIAVLLVPVWFMTYYRTIIKCQNQTFCDGKIWPGSGSAWICSDLTAWIRIRIETYVGSETLDVTQIEFPFLALFQTLSSIYAVTYVKKGTNRQQEMSGTNRAHLLPSRKPVVFKCDSFFQAFVVRLSFSALPLPSEVRGGRTDRSWPYPAA